MFHDARKNTTALHHFTLQQHEALQNAAFYLGAKAGLLRAQRLIDSVASQPLLSRSTLRNAWLLHDLLSLRNAHVPDTIECELFGSIDPASHEVEEICLLADDLRSALEQSTTMQRSSCFPKRTPRISVSPEIGGQG